MNHPRCPKCGMRLPHICPLSDKPKREKKPSVTVDDENLTEAERAMLRQDEEDQAKLEEYEKTRQQEREKEEEELRLLKEKQEQRRLQREEEERAEAERKKADEERRRIEEEERRARMEEERKKKEEEKKKKMAALGGGFNVTGGGPNFVIPEKKDKGDKFGNIVQAKQEMGMTKEQQEEAKNRFLVELMKTITVSDLSGADLKHKVKELHQRICRLETEKYDLEKREERQTYDLRELNERQRQVARQNRNGKGPVDDGTGGRHPVRYFSA
ncbi:Protein TNT-4 c [Aphelenchoides avenae]|nr:Protein TNT-4 c [Aphelenchus avenae]